MSDKFRAFVHAPFKDDDAGERNDTSLAMQVTLYDGPQKLCTMLLGDLSYPIIKRIFEVSDADDLAWNVLLAPHHCSKAVMYWKDEGEDKEKLKKHRVSAYGIIWSTALAPSLYASTIYQGVIGGTAGSRRMARVICAYPVKKHLVDEMDKTSLEPNRVVSSSNPVPSSNKSGDNPPHVKAKTQYETITDSFLCTMDQDEPIIAELKDRKIGFAGVATASMSASQAADEARGSNEPPKSAHTYGSGRD